MPHILYAMHNAECWPLSAVTSLRVRRQTRDRLSEIGSKDETFDEIVERLIDFYKKTTGREESRDRITQAY